MVPTALELAGRIPIQLTPGQSRLVAGLVLGLVLGLVVLLAVESLLGGVAGIVLRLTGRRPPDRSAISSALDELEARLQRRR